MAPTSKAFALGFLCSLLVFLFLPLHSTKDAPILHRYGMQQATVAANFPKTYQITEKAYVGLVGLATDQQTVHELLRMKARMYKLR